ncbi:pentatricopeptide repeat-containing protein [Prunus yedoensis var. nudiflora]|uniref:Pentatricopeptide repeat-containing protein n=1 Tax=Prunus yedoensis var. nudiflora TaxID=2094558 RepID=A0A314YKI7_PRUYE|nr:pentatricopeptide repeat-containing protein [Prunus yedoensis var. nudiflora]
MRHGRPFLVKEQRSASQLGDILLVASITKTLSSSGTRNLPDPHTLSLSEPLLLQILRAQSLHPSKKLDFFKWCSLTHNIKHSARTYSHILRTASRAGFLHEVPHLLHSMKEDGVVVDSQTFKALLDAFIRSDMYNSVLAALLLEGGCSSQVPNSIACNELLVALRKADMRVEFKQVFDKLRENKGFEMDNWGYNICIHAFGCWGDLGTSLSLFKEMKDSNLESVGPDLPLIIASFMCSAWLGR